jgi:hypothetical protein
VLGEGRGEGERRVELGGVRRGCPELESAGLKGRPEGGAMWGG